MEQPLTYMWADREERRGWTCSLKWRRPVTWQKEAWWRCWWARPLEEPRPPGWPCGPSALGEGEPAPIEEDVPPELFEADERTTVFHTIRYWHCNWMVALENTLDSHNCF